jgi:hypothetical protein
MKGRRSEREPDLRNVRTPPHPRNRFKQPFLDSGPPEVLHPPNDIFKRHVSVYDHHRCTKLVWAPQRHAQLARVRLGLGFKERTNDGRTAAMVRFFYAEPGATAERAVGEMMNVLVGATHEQSQRSIRGIAGAAVNEHHGYGGV